MTKHLQPQLKNAKEIKSVLKKINIEFKLAGGRKVETLMVYLPII